MRVLTIRTLVTLLVAGLAGHLTAAPLKPAHVTAVIKEVKLVPAQNRERKAVVNDEVRENTAVRTGVESRAELNFAGKTLGRLGANTLFHFKAGTRNLNVEEGVMLLQVPKKAKGVRIESGEIGAAVTGTTVVFENHPTVFKFVVLQGTARLYRRGHFGESMLVRAGQMVFGDPKAKLTDPVDFDVARFVKTCRLISDFAPLETATLIASESRKQEKARAKKTLIDTNLVIFGGGTLVSLVDPAQMQKTAADAKPSSSPPPLISSQPGQNPMSAVETARSVSR
jgi:mannose-6-phosphate isomerase-like protein (cupin superfamily)